MRRREPWPTDDPQWSSLRLAIRKGYLENTFPPSHDAFPGRPTGLLHGVPGRRGRGEPDDRGARARSTAPLTHVLGGMMPKIV